jgi:hypothetical protein
MDLCCSRATAAASLAAGLRLTDHRYPIQLTPHQAFQAYVRPDKCRVNVIDIAAL